ncbi:MAG: hypothetical protein ACKVX9_23205 [Blastocatellia bacterium]
MKRRSKREMVLEIYDREAMGEVTAREIAVINRGLIEEYGEGGAMAPAEIARILRDEDLPVRFEQVFRMMTPTEKYENLFDGLAHCASLDAARAAIQRIDELFGKFQERGDRTGERFALQTARAARAFAEEQAASARLSADERREMAEIALWFTIWLQTPALFDQWLELRMMSADFLRSFERLKE